MRKPCLNCQTPFHVTRDRKKYCSPECSLAHQRTGSCVVCCAEFVMKPRVIAQKYCSDTCRKIAFTAKRKPVEPIKKNCADCGCELPLDRGSKLREICKKCSVKRRNKNTEKARAKYAKLGHCIECGAEAGRVCRDEDNKPAPICKGRT